MSHIQAGLLFIPHKSMLLPCCEKRASDGVKRDNEMPRERYLGRFWRPSCYGELGGQISQSAPSYFSFGDVLERGATSLELGA